MTVDQHRFTARRRPISHAQFSDPPVVAARVDPQGFPEYPYRFLRTLEISLKAKPELNSLSVQYCSGSYHPQRRCFCHVEPAALQFKQVKGPLLRELVTRADTVRSNWHQACCDSDEAKGEGGVWQRRTLADVRLARSCARRAYRTRYSETAAPLKCRRAVRNLP